LIEANSDWDVESMVAEEYHKSVWKTTERRNNTDLPPTNSMKMDSLIRLE
jgi:hypothetical protein